MQNSGVQQSYKDDDEGDVLVVNVAKDTIDPRVGSLFWRFKYDQVGYSRKDHPNCSSVR